MTTESYIQNCITVSLEFLSVQNNISMNEVLYIKYRQMSMNLYLILTTL